MANLLGIVFLLTPLTLLAKDYGVRGQTFPIEEEDLIDYIRNRTNSIDNQRIQDHYARSFKQPRPVSGLEEAKESIQFIFLILPS